MNQVQFTTVVVPFDDNLPAELKKIEADGYQQVPGLKPFITYTLFKNIEEQQPEAPRRGDQHAGMVQMGIDDSKVHIVRNGQRVG